MRGDHRDHRATQQNPTVFKAPGSAASLSLDILFEAPLSLNASVLNLHYDAKWNRQKKARVPKAEARCVMGRTFIGA